jgi:two-component system nitrogen regulation response regulator GlnG
MSPTQNVQPSDLPNEILEVGAGMSNGSDFSWEDGFVSWLKNLLDSEEMAVLDFVNPKIEKLLIKTALEKTNGKKNDAAKLLGWGRNTLAKKIKELGI